MTISIDKIVSQIVELSLDINSEDQVRDIYSILLDVDLGAEKIMHQILDQERINELNAKVISKSA